MPIESHYNEVIRSYTYTDEQFKVNREDYCSFGRTANNCSIYGATSGGCDNCCQNKTPRVPNYRPRPRLPDNINLI